MSANARCAIETRRVNDDPREDSWEWLLISNGRPVAISWNQYASAKGARAASRRVVKVAR